MNSSIEPKPKLTIGMPAYNEEAFIRKRLENIFAQTFNDFELIISDNGSTDSMSMICKEFASKDKRIKFFQHSKNSGWVWNHKFVLEKALGEYFVWAAVDDKWDSNFLQRNIDVLNSKKNVIASISKIKRYGPSINEFKVDPNDSFITKCYKRIRRHFRPFGPYPASGTFEQKIKIYLKKPSALPLYSVFRRDVLKKSIIHERISVWDLALTIEVLKHGDLHVIDEVLLYRYTGGVSSYGIWDEYSRQKEIRLFEVFFPHSSFTKWCMKSLGRKLFLKNLHHFIWLNCWGLLGIIFSSLMWFKK